MWHLSPCHGESSLARAQHPVLRNPEGQTALQPPWQCRVGKGLTSQVENLSYWSCSFPGICVLP